MMNDGNERLEIGDDCIVNKIGFMIASCFLWSKNWGSGFGGTWEYPYILNI